MGFMPTSIALYLLMALDNKYNYREYLLNKFGSSYIYYSIIVIVYLGIQSAYFAFTGIIPFFTPFGYAMHYSCAF